MKLYNLLLSPDSAPGTSGAPPATPTPEQQQIEQDNLDVLATPAPADGTPTPDAAAGTPPATPPTPATPAGSLLTKEDLTAILESVIPAAQQQGQRGQSQQQQPQEPQLTQADYERMFQVWQPSEQLVAQLRSDDPKKAVEALVELRNGLIRQAMTMADYRVQQIRDALISEHITPIQSFVTEQQATSFRNDFFKTHPDLEPYEAIVDAVALRLQNNGFRGKSREDTITAFAKESKAVVDKLLAAGAARTGAATPTNGNAAAPVAATATTSQRKMSTLLGGGQGGGQQGKGTAQDAKGPAGIEVFD